MASSTSVRYAQNGISVSRHERLIDHFNGITKAANEISNHDNVAISAITWTEVAVELDAAGLAEVDRLIAALPIYVLHTDDAIVRETARLCAAIIHANQHGQWRKIKTPDAIILATAHLTGRMLITRDADDFRSIARVPLRTPHVNSGGPVTNITAPP